MEQGNLLLQVLLLLELWLSGILFVLVSNYRMTL